MQYLKQADGNIIGFTPVFVSTEKGDKVQVTALSGKPSTKAAYDSQEAKRAIARAEAQAEAAKIKEVSNRQFKEALIRQGKDGAAEATVNGLPSGTPEEVATKKVVLNLYYNSNSFQRSNPTLLSFAPALGLNTPADIDAFFAYAATL